MFQTTKQFKSFDDASTADASNVSREIALGLQLTKRSCCMCQLGKNAPICTHPYPKVIPILHLLRKHSSRLSTLAGAFRDIEDLHETQQDLRRGALVS